MIRSFGVAVVLVVVGESVFGQIRLDFFLIHPLRHVLGTAFGNFPDPSGSDNLTNNVLVIATALH